MSENDFNSRVIAEFHAAGGSAASVGDMPLLLLHHIGSRTGLARVTPLAYVKDAGRYVILASGGGKPRNPEWFRNLMARGYATVEVETDRFRVRAQEAAGEERERLFKTLVERVPDFADYIKTDRLVPVVLLTPQKQH